MQIQRNLRGGRTVVSEHSGARIVTTGRGNGYVQRAYVTRGGHSYYSRTYYERGAYRVGIYRGYNYGGYHYYGYYPGFWYNPGFYGWAYQPWGAPVYWGIGMGGWGWGGSPWYGYYGGYFSPYPVYASPAFWLTDYVIAANLQAAYASQSDTAAYDQVPTQLRRRRGTDSKLRPGDADPRGEASDCGRSEGTTRGGSTTVFWRTGTSSGTRQR